MKLACKIFVYTIIVLLLIVAVIGLCTLQSEAKFKNTNAVNVQTAAQSKKAIKRVVRSLKNNKEPANIFVTQTELNGLNALFNRAFPKIASQVNIDKKTANIDLSVELPLPNFIKYLNISGTLNPSQQGIDLSDVTIGRLTFSGNKLIAFGRFFVDFFIQDELGTKLVSMVRWVKINPHYLRVSVLIPEGMNQLNPGKSSLLALRDNLALFGDVTTIKRYHNHIVQHLDDFAHKDAPKKLDYYLQLVFTLAKNNSQNTSHSNSTGQYIVENYSALMALAIYFGSDSFELLIGDITTLTPNQKTKRQILRRTVTLRNRVDLQKHYIYSAALQLFGNAQASDTIGEIKEFLDSNGGSGFSFADLMADRAGTRLAQLATQSEKSARRVQQILSNNINEGIFMPNIDGMPEGISAEFFTINYRDVNSTEYKKMITLLDNKLKQLTLFNQ